MLSDVALVLVVSLAVAMSHLRLVLAGVGVFIAFGFLQAYRDNARAAIVPVACDRCGHALELHAGARCLVCPRRRCQDGPDGERYRRG